MQFVWKATALEGSRARRDISREPPSPLVRLKSASIPRSPARPRRGGTYILRNYRGAQPGHLAAGAFAPDLSRFAIIPEKLGFLSMIYSVTAQLLVAVIHGRAVARLGRLALSPLISLSAAASRGTREYENPRIIRADPAEARRSCRYSPARCAMAP